VDPTGRSFVLSNSFRVATRRASSSTQVEPLSTGRQQTLQRNVKIKTLQRVTAQTTKVKGFHSFLDVPPPRAWKVEQEIDWGPVTRTTAVVKKVTFRYYVLTQGLVFGGKWSVYGGLGPNYHYINGFNDRNRYYTATVSARPSGGFSVVLNESFLTASSEQSIVVDVDKHSQVGGYESGTDYHRIFTVAYRS
jgi:hypothetical protein